MRTSHADSCIRCRRGSALFLVAFLFQMTACSTRSDATGGAVERPSEAIATLLEISDEDPVQFEGEEKFEGEWSYRNDCDRGHYVTLELKRENELLVGSWSDGTLLRGSQGMVKGRVDKNRFIAEWCDESEQVGSPALCPSYEKSDDYLVARDGRLVWYQKYGQEYVEYVTLNQGSESHMPMKACDEDN